MGLNDPLMILITIKSPVLRYGGFFYAYAYAYASLSMPAVNLHKQAMTIYKDEEPRPDQSQDVKKDGLAVF